LKNIHFFSRPRKAKILPAGIHQVFRGLKFEPDTGIGKKEAFFNGFKKNRAVPYTAQPYFFNCVCF